MYARVALPIPVQTLFVYEIPSHLRGKIGVGHGVLVPLERRLASGFVVELIPQTKIKGVKEIIGLLNPEPLFSERIMNLTQYVSQYYFCSWGESLKAALPAEFQAQTVLRLKKEDFDQKAAEDVSQRQSDILNLFKKRHQLKLSSVKRKLGYKEIHSDLIDLQKKGFVEFSCEYPLAGGDLGGEKYVRTTNLHLEQGRLEKLKARAPAQWECLQALLKNQGELSLDELKRVSGSKARAINELEKKGLVEVFQREKKTDEAGPPVASAPPEQKLSSEEFGALSRIVEVIEQKKHAVFLLYGSSNSRVRIYVETLKEVLQRQRQACILVPEIFSISPFVSRLKSYFGHNIASFHSRLPASQRFSTWKRIKAGELPVVVGTRSAVFSPADNPGLFIVDQEHDASYKQEDLEPRYHARDVAVKRGELEKAVVILGSATPSLESFHKAWKGDYIICSLGDKVREKAVRRVEIVDMHKERKEGNFSPFSRRLSHSMEQNLSRKDKVVLFLNRRGFSRAVRCQDCGFVYRCPNCNIALTFHHTDSSLRCHFCNFKTTAQTTCPECRGHSFSYAGTGTQRIDEEIKKNFPSASVLRMDVDTASGRKPDQSILKTLKSKDFDLLLGTRMIAKEWGLPEAGLVGVVSADFSLDLPDFRAKERTFQVLYQVISIAREDGEVIIQTYHPEDCSISLAPQGDFKSFYGLEIAQRKELKYPPFANLILIRFSGKSQKDVSDLSKRFATRLKRKLESAKDVDILGPAPAPISKVRGRYRYQALVKTKRVDHALESIRSTVGMKSLKKSPSVRITINVDPVEMM